MRNREKRNGWNLFALRVTYLPLPVYVVSALIWRFALREPWLLSLAGVPLGLFMGGVIYCGVTTLFIMRKRRRG